jgi:superfamily II DNA/RNA helicase
MQRDRVMKLFRERKVRLLVATNVAARGLDVSELDHVISFRLPDELAGYTHRSGRTGRAGRQGVSSVLITPRERSKIPYIERSLGCRFLLQPIPDGATVCTARIAAWLERVRLDEHATERIAPFASGILAQLENIPRDELVTKLLSAQFKDLLEYYRKSSDLNVADRRSPDARSGRNRGQMRRGKEAGPKPPRSTRRVRKSDDRQKPADAGATRPKSTDVSVKRKRKSPKREVAAISAKPKTSRKQRKDNTPEWVKQAMQGGKKKQKGKGKR